MSYAKRVRDALNSAKKAYLTGKTPYPRVDNLYNDSKQFEFYPHPPLEEFDGYSKPLAFDGYHFNKDTALLELSNLEISTPATLETMSLMIDEYFDESMNLLPRMERECHKKLDGYYKFIDWVNDREFGSGEITPTNISNTMGKDGAVAYFPMSVTPFQIKLSPDFTKDRIKREEEANKAEIEKDKNSTYKMKFGTGNFKKIEKKITPVDNIIEAIKLHKDVLAMIEYLKNAENIQIEAVKAQHKTTKEQNISTRGLK